MKNSPYPNQLFTIEEWKISSASLIDEVTEILLNDLTPNFLKAEPYSVNMDGTKTYFPTILDEENGIALNLIPGGTFKFGLCQNHKAMIEAIADKDELQLFADLLVSSMDSKNVTIKPFLMSRFPLFEAAAEDIINLEDNIYRPDYSDGGRGPFPIALTLQEAHEFNLKTGYRLPTSAEWEYVAKAQSESLFLGGEDSMPEGRKLASLCLTSYGNAKKNQQSYNTFGIAAMAVSNMVSGADGVEVRAGAAEFFPFQGASEWAMLLSELRIPLSNMPGKVSAIRPCLDIPSIKSSY